MMPALQHLSLAAWIAILGSMTSVAANDSESPAQADYPKPFSRPPSMGENYDTWKDAKGPDVGVTKVDPARLPSRVDNSTRPEFPPIYKQNGGACGQFTAIASIFTYEMNVMNDTHANTDANRFPADFSWNMVNGADKENGSEAYHGWETARHVGIPTVKTYGTVHRKEAGPWPNGYEIWREAMQYRVAGYRYTPATTVAQINEARGWLFDRNQPKSNKEAIGGLLALDGRMGEREKVTKTIPDGEHQAGEELWIRWGPSGYGHGITCVGYDDRVGYDVNGDGKITNDIDTNGDQKITLADWERGAFIVVNSWGKNWANDGKIYLLYSAMTDPTWRRGNFLGRIEVSQHVPQHTLKLKLSHNKRSDLRVTIGIASEKNATQPEHELVPQVLNGWPLFGNPKNNVGAVPLAGTDDNTPLELGIDLTPLFNLLKPDVNNTGRLFLRFSSADKSNASGKLESCAIRCYDKNGKFIRESTVEIPDGNFSKTTLNIETTFH
jgi:hypothetical protein